MSGLRAPDPTLAALDRMVVVSRCADSSREYTAHATVGEHSYGGHLITSGAAAYFAVPCRVCFPSAPPPGCCDAAFCSEVHAELAWQVQP